MTYAQPPGKTNWYAFATVCEVPDGWITSATLPQQEATDCSSYKVTYSPAGGKLHIPFIFLNNADTQPAYQGAEFTLFSLVHALLIFSKPSTGNR
ncbi:MAG: hypothetical protein BWK78_01850 [Thiotrichaceae bacterium IS1]|nr:MAG: hypothetical protein BWK78_01850 [Thiotrichaceae bacterium IS1]